MELPAELRAAHPHLCGPWTVYEQEADRTGGRQELPLLRHGQEQRQGIRPVHQGHPLCRRGRRGRGQGESCGNSGLSPQPAEVHRGGRVDAEGHPARRPSRDWQDHAGKGRRRRGERALLLDKRLRIRGDVRRHGRLQGARPLPPGEGEGPLHRVHRRDRRHRPEA